MIIRPHGVLASLLELSWSPVHELHLVSPNMQTQGWRLQHTRRLCDVGPQFCISISSIILGWRVEGNCSMRRLNFTSGGNHAH